MTPVLNVLNVPKLPSESSSNDGTLEQGSLDEDETGEAEAEEGLGGHHDGGDEDDQEGEVDGLHLEIGLLFAAAINK